MPELKGLGPGPTGHVTLSLVTSLSLRLPSVTRGPSGVPALRVIFQTRTCLARRKARDGSGLRNAIRTQVR